MFRVSLSSLVIALLTVLTGIRTDCVAQSSYPNTGRANFGVQLPGGPIDTLDPSTGFISIVIPIRSKASMSYDLSFTSGIYGYLTWSSVTNASVHSSTSDNVGFGYPNFLDLGYWAGNWTLTTRTCNSDTHDQVYSSFLIYDAVGTPHPLSSSFTFDADGCIPVPANAETIDESGLWVVTHGSRIETTWTIYDRFGNGSTGGPINFSVATPSGVSASAAYSSANYTTTYTDPLGTTGSQSYLVVTPDTSTPPNTLWYQYSYTDEGGNTQQYQVNYSLFTLATAFKCTNVIDIKGDPNFPITLPTSVSIPGGGSYKFSYEVPYGMVSPYTTGRITKITYPDGGYTTYAYSGTNGNGGTGGIDCNSGVVPTLTRSVNDNNGHSAQTRFLSSAASGSFGSPTYPITVQQADPSGNYTVYTMYSEYPSTIKYYQGAATGTPLKTVSYCYWNSSGIENCNSKPAVYPPFTEIDRYTSLNASTSNEVKTTYDIYGDVTGVYMFDYGATTPTQQTLITYGTWNGTACVALSGQTVSQYIVGTPCDTKDENGSGTIVKEARITYDGYGRATDQYNWTGTTFLHSSATYNGNGTIATSTDKNGALSTYTYNGTGGCNNLLPTSVKATGSGLPSTGLTTSMQWNCNGGVPTSFTDANNQTWNHGYVNQSGTPDPFWRLLSVTDSLSNVTWTTYSSTGTLPQTVETYVNFPVTSPTSTVDTLYTLDGLGRMIESEKRTAPGATTFDNVISYVYTWNSTGLVTTQTIPGGSAVTTTQMDAIGRVISVTDGGAGTVTSTYSQNDVLNALGPAPTNEHLKQVQNQYDGLGRLQESCMIGNGSTTACGQNTGTLDGVTTANSYTYAPGSSTTTSTRGVQTRTTIYDAMGRITQVTIPETGVTPWTYYYDSYSPCPSGYQGVNGQLAAVKDPNANLLCYSYDALNRVTGVNADGTTCRHFYYDNSTGYSGSIPTGVSTPTYSSRRMVEAATDSCTGGTLITDEWFSYDKDGNVTDMWEKTPHSTQYYHSVATFLGNGKVKTLQLASPLLYTMTWGLDGEGRWNTLTDTTSGKALVTGATYFPAANPAVVSLTGTDNDSFTFDANTGRMTQFLFTVGNTPKSLTGKLNWNTNGTLNNLAITDGFNAGGTQTCNFNSTLPGGMGYDDWDRLLGVDCGSGQWGQTFSYDIYDNLGKSASFSGRIGTTWLPGYSATTNHCNGCTYDADGNVTGDGNNVYGWNEFSKVSWTATSGIPTCGSSGRCAVYDAFGRMVERSVGSTWYEQWVTQGGTAWMSGSTINYAYWPAPEGGKVLLYGNSSNYDYLHGDWLGNARIDSDLSNHTVTTDQAYTPYGEIYDIFGSNVGQNEIFATMEGHFAPGTTTPVMWDTPNRELSIVSRWLSPDPARVGWNQYAHVTNPNSATDPSGLGPCAGGGYPMNGFGAGDSSETICSGIAVNAVTFPSDYVWINGEWVPLDGWAWWGGVIPNNRGNSGGISGASSIFTGQDFPWAVHGADAVFQSIWSEVLGLPTGLNCPQSGGIFSPLCGGVSALIDAEPANNVPQVSRPPNPILTYDTCATKVRSQAKTDKWTITIIQQISFSDLLAACGFTGPDAPACLGIVGGVSGTVSVVNWAGYVNSVWDGETKCLQNN